MDFFQKGFAVFLISPVEKRTKTPLKKVKKQ
jgi:hypothetical protein